MARFLFVLIGLCIFFSASWTRADIGVDLLQLSRSEQWLRLLHYKSRFPFGNLRSEAEPGSFFFSPDGRRDPYAELKANVAAFENSQNEGQRGSSLQCSFPARYHFLKTHLNWQWVDDKCPELDAFLKKVGGDQLSIVFSSAYPNSPPSMFGHTMLRVHSRERAELLDYGINYSASASADENALAFAVFGLTGGYFGKFGVVPYYMKVNEYNHAESRDLWEYDLSLTPSEIQVFYGTFGNSISMRSFDIIFSTRTALIESSLCLRSLSLNGT